MTITRQKSWRKCHHFLLAGRVNGPQAKETVLKSSCLPHPLQECFGQRSQSRQKSEKASKWKAYPAMKEKECAWKEELRLRRKREDHSLKTGFVAQAYRVGPRNCGELAGLPSNYVWDCVTFSEFQVIRRNYFLFSGISVEIQRRIKADNILFICTNKYTYMHTYVHLLVQINNKP